jgi:hypothetical protein
MTRIPEGVGWTALLTAYGRAQESREAAKLFDDPLASMFLEAVTDAGVSSDVETSDEQERAAWDLVRQAFLYGPAGVGPADWLAGHGWTPGQVTTITELGSRHRRHVPPEFARASAARVWLFDGTLGRTPQG